MKPANIPPAAAPTPLEPPAAAPTPLEPPAAALTPLADAVPDSKPATTPLTPPTPPDKPDTPSKPALKPTNKWLALCVTSLGTLVSTINSSSINIANPVLSSEFGIPMEQVQWVTTTYLIVICSLMLLMGRMGDRVGSHKVYITGVFIFITGTLLCGFSSGFILLLGARMIQALGAAMMLATSMGLVATIFPQEQRGTAIGINVIMVGVGGLCGPSLGGLLLSIAAWPMIFFVSLPFACITAALAVIFLRSPVLPIRNAPPLDKLGVLILAAMITVLILGLSGGFPNSHWFLLALVILAPLFLFVERRQPQPLVEMSLMRKKRFSLGNLITFMSYTANMMVSFQLPFFLEELWGIPVGSAGLLLAASALSMAVFGPISGLISDRVGALRVMPVALILLIVALITALFIPGQPAILHFLICLVLIGSGMGLLNTPNNSEIMTAAGRRFASYASGFVATNRNLAFCFGTGVSAGVFATLRGTFEISYPPDDAWVFAFRSILGIALVLMIASFCLCLYLRRHEKTLQQSPEA